jgi:hypothetical protein
MTMMKSTYRKKHVASKYDFPTKPGESRSGEGSARQDIERRIGRQLQSDTVTRHTRSQWVFLEPKHAVAGM